MPYRKDPLYISAVWGRIGVAILLMVAFALGGAGFIFSEALQSQAYDAINMVLVGVGTILVIISKVRESKKVDE